MLNLKREKTSGETRRQDNPINQWVRLNRFLLFYRYALIVLGTVIFGFILLTFYLVNRDPLVIALTNHEKLFFFAEHRSVPVTEADVQEFSKLFIKTRYAWTSQNPDKLLKELAPLTSPGLLQKIEEALSRNKKELAQSALSQDVLIRTLTLENGRVLAQIDRVVAIGEKMKVVNPLGLTLTVIRGSPNRYNPAGLYVNSVIEHEIE